MIRRNEGEDRKLNDAQSQLPTVLLLGDSIRLGYQPVVTAQLAGTATVWGPEANGQDTVTTLAHLDAWLTAVNPAVIHWNCGLHDLKREHRANGGNGATETVVPLAQYAENLTTIIDRIRAHTAAPLIFATTTPIHEARHAARGLTFARFAADVDTYNNAARAVCARLYVPVDDLYRVVTDAGGVTLMLPDGTHYTEDGYRILGTAVTHAVRPHLR